MKTARNYVVWSIVSLALFVLLGGMSVRAQVTQDQTAENVRSALLKLPYYGVFDFLEFSIGPDRTVTLKGYVTRPSLKSDAEAAAKGVKGVETVQNDIQVLPLSSTDDQIRLALARAIYGGDSSLQRYGVGANPPIHIIVNNGNVSLEGVVASENDKNIAGIQAKSVGGTFTVKNDLKVEESQSSAKKAE